MEKKYRVGLIGCGGIAKGAHIPSYKLEGRAEIVAVCDIKKERAEFVRKAFFRNAAVYEDYKELLKDESIDYVDICTPNYMHSVIAVDALNAGKHVLCEKPDAVNVEEALKMKEAAERNGKKLMVIRNNRYIDTSKAIKKMADEGFFGEFYAGRCGWIRRRGIPGLEAVARAHRAHARSGFRVVQGLTEYAPVHEDLAARRAAFVVIVRDGEAVEILGIVDDRDLLGEDRRVRRVLER